MPSDAFVFPGQGAHSTAMLEPFRAAPSFPRWYALIGELLGRDPLDPAAIDENAHSSLLTALASAAGLELLRGPPPVAVAGYSVGQLSALHAAGALAAEELFRLVRERARIMDAHAARAGRTGMMAVIGVKLEDISRVTEEVSARGEWLEVTNDNAPAQVTVGGSEAGLSLAEALLHPLKPKKLARVRVAGAWHSRILLGAVPELSALLASSSLRVPELPVADNTTGEWLPRERDALIARVARQVAAPVLWRACAGALIAAGAERLLEVGFGDVLTRYGFFISRAVRHEAMAPSPR